MKTDNKINLLLVREDFTDKSTIGTLYINGDRICDTLENPYLDNKPNISSIPLGEYSVRLRLARESASRDYLHLLVQSVPYRKYILFHVGNYPTQTKGCILVGLTRGNNFVKNSKDAMSFLMEEIVTLGGENINLIIKNKNHEKVFPEVPNRSDVKIKEVLVCNQFSSSSCFSNLLRRGLRYCKRVVSCYFSSNCRAGDCRRCKEVIDTD